MNDLEFIRIKRNLTALIEFSRNVNSGLDMSFTLNNLLLSCMGKFLVTKGLIALFDKNNVLSVIQFKGISKETVEEFPIIANSDNCEKLIENTDFFIKNGFVLCEKIVASTNTLGVLFLGERIDKKFFSDDEREFLRTIINIASTAIQNSLFIDELKSVNRDLDTRINRLSSLFEIGKEFGLLADESRITKLLVYSLLGNFLISVYSIVVTEGNRTKVLETTIPKTRITEALKNICVKDIHNTLIGEVIQAEFPSLFELNVEAIIPMTLNNETKGVILLGKRINKHSYSESDIEFISSLGAIAIISLENRRLFKEALEKQKLEEELELAKDIQKNLLPKSIPQLKNMEIASFSLASRQVGGDYYDIIKLDNKNYCISIADVSGKGIPASLLMANLQAFLKSICKQGMELDIATGIINDLISENTTDGRFITFFWGILNDEERTLRYVNAGHNPPLLVRNGKIEYLTKGGMLLGVMPTMFPYECESIQLQADDVIVLFTDGITEAKNSDDEEFSDEKLEETVLFCKEESAEGLLNSIKSEISKFTAGYSQSDDITLLTIKIK